MCTEFLLRTLYSFSHQVNVGSMDNDALVEISKNCQCLKHLYLSSNTFNNYNLGAHFSPGSIALAKQLNPELQLHFVN